MSKSELPLLIYDGECGFCKRSLHLLDEYPGIIAQPIASQRYHGNELNQQQLASSVHLVWPDHQVESGAQAIFKLLKLKGKPQLYFFYTHFFLFRLTCDRLYQFIAQHRKSAARSLNILMSIFKTAESHSIGTRIGEIFLMISFFSLFASLIPQYQALWGNNGIAPMQTHLLIEYMNIILLAGALSALIGIFYSNFIPLLFCLLLAYWIIINGGPFMSFQWDMLLLEMGIVALLSRIFKYSVSMNFVWKLLAFKLIFSSGMVKILSPNPAWINLEALTVHFSTQPLATPLSYLFHNLPQLLLQSATAMTLIIQIILPIGLFINEKISRICALILIIQQIIILLSGNYTYFNLLTIGLLCGCIANQYWTWLHLSFKSHSAFLSRLTKEPVAFIFAIPLIVFSLINIPNFPNIFPASWQQGVWRNWGINNSYGLFASMTMERPEIILETSENNQNWQVLDFPYKIDSIKDCPRWVAPYQPRLDWQMWFAALAGPSQRPWWVNNFLIQLLNNQPNVLKLINHHEQNTQINYIRGHVSYFELITPNNGQCWRKVKGDSNYLDVISRENIRRP